MPSNMNYPDETPGYAVEAIKTDNHVQKIMDIFGATLD